MSFGEANIELNDKGYTLVSGINRNPNDNSDSNGSGKSSIWEAISWVLTGNTIRGNKDVVNIHASNGCKVELSFSVNGDNYKVIRTKDHKKFGSSLSIFINGEDKSGKGIRDSEKLLLEYLPDITASLLGSVIILGQGLPQRFTNNSPSGRKEVLEKLSKSDYMIEDIKNKLSLRKSVLQKELREFEDKNLSADVKLSSTQRTIDEFESKLKNVGAFEELDIELNALDVKIRKLSNEISEVSEEKDKVFALLDTIQEQIDRNSADREFRKSELNKKFDEEIRELLDELASLSTKGKLLASDIEEKKSIKDVCPTCGQKLPNVIKPDYSKLEEQLVSCREQYKRLKLQSDVKQKENDELIKKELEVFDKFRVIKCNELNAQKDLFSNLSSKLKSLENDKNSCIREYDSINANKLSLTNRIEEYKETIKQAKVTLNTLNEEKLYIISGIESTNGRLDVINKMITLATRDFRGFLLSNVIDFIDKRTKEYSNDIFGTDKVLFCLEGNSINISYDGKMFESLSGGEQQKVNIIIQFALRDTLCQLCDFSSNILVLDEIFDNLDLVGCQKILDLISNKLIDVESIFIVTHHSDIQIPADSEIIVIKNKDGISTIK